MNCTWRSSYVIQIDRWISGRVGSALAKGHGNHASDASNSIVTGVLFDCSLLKTENRQLTTAFRPLSSLHPDRYTGPFHGCRRHRLKRAFATGRSAAIRRDNMNRHNHLRRVSAATALAVALALTQSACDKGSQSGGGSGGGGSSGGDSIKVGHLASLTGKEATFGQSAEKGIRIALEEINNAGGLLGKQVEVITVDTQSKNQEVNNCMVKLTQKDQVCAVVGEIASGNTIAAAPRAQSAKVPLVTPGSTNPVVTQKGDYVFRICYTDDFQGAAIAGFAARRLEKKQAVTITDQSSPYSLSLTEEFKKAFEKEGGKVLDDVSYKGTDTDYNALINKVLSSKPDVLVLTGYYTNVGNIIQTARKAGYTGPCVGGDGWDSETLYKIGGKALDDCYFTNHYSPEDPDPQIQSFIKKFKELHNNEMPDAMAVLGYDAAMVVFDAIKRAGSAEGPKIRDALAGTKNFKGVSGTITIDENRNAQKTIVIVGVKDAKQYLKEVWKG